MAAVNITISGVICDKWGRTIMPCTIVGEASITGLGVGGGPIVPPDQGGGGSPPGIWGGGNVPMPTPPIANVPGAPGYRPPGDHIWGPTDPRPTPPIANVPGIDNPDPPGKPDCPPPTIWPPGPGIDFPAHPIVIPPPGGGGDLPGIPPGTLIDWKPIWTPDGGWQIIGVPNVPHPVPSGA